jgi:hypothetical protein
LPSDWSRLLPQRIVIPTVATLTTLADARVLIEQLPEDHRASPVWRDIMTQLEQSAAGIEVVDLRIAIRLAPLLEGLEYQAQ